jgi:hypothetical protein
MNKKHLIISVLSVLIALGAIFSAYTVRQKAQAQAAMIPFGGMILYVDDSSCCNGAIVTIQDAVTNAPIQLLYEFGVTLLFAEQQIWTPGVNTVGLYMPGTAICLDMDSECEPTSSEMVGSMFEVGTSAL